MSSLTSIVNAVGDAALPFGLLIRSEPLAGPQCENEGQLLNGGLLAPLHSSAPFKRITSPAKMLLLNRQNAASAPSKELERRKPRGRSLFPDTHAAPSCTPPKGEGGLRRRRLQLFRKSGKKTCACEQQQKIKKF